MLSARSRDPVALVTRSNEKTKIQIYKGRLLYTHSGTHTHPHTQPNRQREKDSHRTDKRRKNRRGRTNKE